MYVEVVICSKYKNLNKTTKNYHISLKVKTLFLLYSTVYNAKLKDRLLKKGVLYRKINGKLCAQKSNEISLVMTTHLPLKVP